MFSFDFSILTKITPIGSKVKFWQEFKLMIARTHFITFASYGYSFRFS